jgi:hypothetical protein
MVMVFAKAPRSDKIGNPSDGKQAIICRGNLRLGRSETFPREMIANRCELQGRFSSGLLFVNAQRVHSHEMSA